MVDRYSQMPFIIDFADRYFKDAFQERKEREDEDEGGRPWDPDLEYWLAAMSNNNTEAIGEVMKGKLLRTKGMELRIKYPDYDEIIEGIKHQKATPKRLP